MINLGSLKIEQSFKTSKQLRLERRLDRMGRKEAKRLKKASQTLRGKNILSAKEIEIRNIAVSNLEIKEIRNIVLAREIENQIAKLKDQLIAGLNCDKQQEIRQQIDALRIKAGQAMGLAGLQSQAATKLYKEILQCS